MWGSVSYANYGLIFAFGVNGIKSVFHQSCVCDSPIPWHHLLDFIEANPLVVVHDVPPVVAVLYGVTHGVERIPSVTANEMNAIYVYARFVVSENMNILWKLRPNRLYGLLNRAALWRVGIALMVTINHNDMLEPLGYFARKFEHIANGIRGVPSNNEDICIGPDDGRLVMIDV